MRIELLDEAIKSAGIPIDGVSCVRGVVSIDFRPEASSEQRATANAIADGWDWSPEAEAERIAQKRATEVAALIQSTDAIPAAVRRVVSAVVRCVNKRHPDNPITEAEVMAELAG